MKENITHHNPEKPYKNQDILYEKVAEEDKMIKWTINIVTLLGGIGFLTVGLSSYLKNNIIWFLNADEIIFFPQGLTMCFYGICGIIVSINQIRILILKIGEGYNEFNKLEGIMKIYRKGFFGENSDINIIYPLTDIVRD